jgi:hypothetical protein
MNAQFLFRRSRSQGTCRAATMLSRRRTAILLLVVLLWTTQPLVAQSDTPSLSVSRIEVVTSPEDSGTGTLRQALLDAQAGNTILFDSVAFPPAHPVTISLHSELPTIVMDDLTLDGSDAGVILDGSRLTDGAGLLIHGADGVVVRGLQIVNFPESGIVLDGGASLITIGGDRSIGKAPLGQGNLLSGNRHAGIWVEDEGTSNNLVIGNYIGTDVAGFHPYGNLYSGVLIGYGASHNILGNEN